MFSIEFDKIVQFRRSNRSFDPNIKVPDEIIQKALEHAILSPNSSNMQLWEFHWISSKDKIEEFIKINSIILLPNLGAATKQAFDKI